MDLLGGYGRRYNYPGILGRLSARNLTDYSSSGSRPVPSAAGLSLWWETDPASFVLQTNPDIRYNNRSTGKIRLSNEISCPRGSWRLAKPWAWLLVL